MHPDRISEDGINLVKKFEGLHKVQPNGMVSAYRCSAGRYTCGYGATRGVRSGTKWTKEYCELRLIEDLNDHAKAIKKYVQVPLYKDNMTVQCRSYSIQAKVRFATQLC